MADLLGTKLVANEFVAFVKLTTEYRGVISDRSYVLATYALTGFANIASIGIQLGGIGGLAPSRRSVSSVYYDTARQELRRAGITTISCTACPSSVIDTRRASWNAAASRRRVARAGSPVVLTMVHVATSPIQRHDHSESNSRGQRPVVAATPRVGRRHTDFSELQRIRVGDDRRVRKREHSFFRPAAGRTHDHVER